MKTDLLAELFDRNVGRLGPTPHRFFTPRTRFWDEMSRFKAGVVVEFGAGRGDTLLEAQAKGYRWTGCDLADNPPELLMRGVYTMSALRFPLAEGMAVIACRPDHSGWCEPALRRALDAGCTAIYVGLESNAERDLGDLYDRIADFIPQVGREGEAMWVFTP